MYLSAQKVRDADGAEGVNVFVYTHRGVDCAGVDWNVPDVGHVADHCPGKLAAAVRSVTAKRATVLAFLDIVAAETLPATAVAQLLQSGAARWPGRGWPTSWHAGPLGLRFFAVRALRSEAQPEPLFRELKDAVLPILGFVVSQERGAATFPVRPPGPIVIERHRTPVGHRFELSPDAVELLRGAVPDATIRSLSISADTMDAFERFTGHATEDEAVSALTGLRLDQVDALAGALVVDMESGETIWRSPGRPRPA